MLMAFPDCGLCCRVCDSVAAGLVGQRLGGFTRISSAVRSAVEGALTRILTPKRSIDILRDIAAAKAKGRPYTIVFVGVNGVGKSTNLAKIAYWLLQNDVSVSLLPARCCPSLLSLLIAPSRVVPRAVLCMPKSVVQTWMKSAARNGIWSDVHVVRR